MSCNPDFGMSQVSHLGENQTQSEEMRTAYSLWADANKNSILQERANFSVQDVGALLAGLWRDVAPSEKAKYEAMATRSLKRPQQYSPQQLSKRARTEEPCIKKTPVEPIHAPYITQPAAAVKPTTT